MTFFHTHLPSGTYDNQGWTIVGENTAHDAVDDDNDNNYIQTPAHRGRCSFFFPVDINNIPTGAKIVSVTLFVRARRVGSTPRRLTLQLTSRDWTARYASRTIYPAETPTTYEVATYTKDPRGRPWDIFTINHVILRLLSSDRIFDCIRVYKYYLRINYTPRPTTTVTAPSGTIITSSPVLSWTYDQDDGDAHLKSQYKIFTASQVNEQGFSPYTELPVYQDLDVPQDLLSLTLPTSINPDTYYLFVRVWSITGARSIWVGKQFQVDGPAPSPPGDDNQSLTGTPGLGTLTATANASTSSFSLAGRGSSNLLSVQQADFEHSDDPLEYVGDNCTLARDVSEFFPGGGKASMSLTASTAADMRADATLIEVGSHDIEDGELIPYTVRAQFKADSTARTCRIDTLFYDESFTLLQTDTGTGVADSTSTWTEIVETGNTVPLATHYAEVRLVVLSPGSGEVHYVDHVGFMYGDGSAWSNGGFDSRNVLTSSLSTGDDPDGDITWTGGNVRSTLSRVATSGIGSHGEKTNRMTYGAGSTSIALVAYGSSYTSPTTGTNFTLNKPSGVSDNDLYVAYVTASEACEMSTVPDGWTLVTSSVVDQGGQDNNQVSLFVLKMNALAADPSTWTDGVLSVSCERRTAIVGCYTGCDPAEEQFLAETSSQDTSGSTTHTTGTVTNTDSNAWRLSAFASVDGTTGNTSIANTQPPNNDGTISYVGKGSVYKQNTSSTSYTLYKPSNVQEDDLMLAFVVFTYQYSTFTPPSGWTLVRHVTVDSNTSGSTPPDTTFAVLKRTAGASEPSSWSGSVSNGPTPAIRIASVVAYRGAANVTSQFIDENVTSEQFTSDDIDTATISNDNSQAWRITAGAAMTGFGASNQYSTEVKERVDETTDRSGWWDPALLVMDSNGAVSTGSHQRHLDWWVNNTDCHSRASWIALLEPEAAGPTPPADETERLDTTIGTGNPVLHTAVYDSGGTVAAQDWSVTQQITLGSGSSIDVSAGWIGILKPAGAIENDEVAAHTSDRIDLSEVDPVVFDLCGNKMTLVASMKGSDVGSSILEIDFYRANEILLTRSAVGGTFDTSTWKKSSVTFDIPAGTTHVRPRIKVHNRADTDTVDFDRIGLMFGDSDVWRNGTERVTHPVWSRPVLQFADDDGSGYTDYRNVFGQSHGFRPPGYDVPSGTLSYLDDTAVPLSTRKYRARTLVYGLAGDQFVSAWGPDSNEVSFTAVDWWLKDISDSSKSMSLKVRAEPFGVGTTNTATAFQPLGEALPVVVSEGYKGDTMEFTALVTHAEWVKLRTLLKSKKTLYLQTNMDAAWWVRSIGDLDSATLVTYDVTTNPLREVSLQFVQVSPPE